MKKLISAILALVLMLGICALAETEVYASSGSTNIRTEPNLDGGKVGALEKGSSLIFSGDIEQDERGVDWYGVYYDDSLCWVSSRYTDIIEKQTEGAPIPPDDLDMTPIDLFDVAGAYENQDLKVDLQVYTDPDGNFLGCIGIDNGGSDWLLYGEFGEITTNWYMIHDSNVTFVTFIEDGNHWIQLEMDGEQTDLIMTEHYEY